MSLSSTTCSALAGTGANLPVMTNAADLLLRAVEAKQQGRLGEASQHVLRAISLLREKPPGIELAKALRLLAELERKLHDKAAALQHYQEAVILCRSHGDPLMLAHTVRHLGDVYQDAAQPELAEPCYREALELYRTHRDTTPLDLANAIRSMAVLKAAVGEIEQARSLWQQARDLYSQVNVSEGVAEASVRIAQLT